MNAATPEDDDLPAEIDFSVNHERFNGFKMFPGKH